MSKARSAVARAAITIEADPHAPILTRGEPAV
ncbi:hypothetical protein a10_04758 [Streptomyces acidiscabies]|nr:hypothetical protein a10_04758 [Streptomyces acidiscabies]